jgi:hypothetical protein
MKPTKLSLLTILLATLFACSKDSDTSSSSASSSTNNTTTSSSLSGTYTGKQIEIYSTSTVNDIGRDTVEGRIFTISGSGESYVMEFIDPDDQSRSTINLTYTNNSINGIGSADPNDYFEGETYTGSISGDQLTLNFTGTYNGDTTYTGSYVGTRPPSGGGGGNSSDFLNVSSFSAGNIIDAACNGDFDASYSGPQTGDKWLLTMFHFNDCGDRLGTIKVKESSNALDEVGIELWLVNSNGDPLHTLESENNSGTLTLSQVGGKLVYEASNLTLTEGSQNYTVSFKATEQ